MEVGCFSVPRRHPGGGKGPFVRISYMGTCRYKVHVSFSFITLEVGRKFCHFDLKLGMAWFSGLNFVSCQFILPV